MKVLPVILLFISASASAYAQNACAKFKNGTFKTTFNGANAIIKRSGNYQREYLSSPKTTVSYVLNWTDECTYTLKPNDDWFKQFPNTPKNALITVSISNVKANAYTQTSRSTFSQAINSTPVTKIF